jgi:hypothetical protein
MMQDGEIRVGKALPHKVEKQGGKRRPRVATRGGRRHRLVFP